MTSMSNRSQTPIRGCVAYIYIMQYTYGQEKLTTSTCKNTNIYFSLYSYSLILILCSLSYVPKIDQYNSFDTTQNLYLQTISK